MVLARLPDQFMASKLASFSVQTKLHEN